MGMQVTTPQADIDAFIAKEIKKSERKILNAYCYVGESCLTQARDMGTYQDQTGNLRSSIGYIVLQNGKVYKKSAFEQIKKGSDGVKEGKKFIDDLISQYSRGMVLLIVAGMNYAAAVESRGQDVITSAELLEEKLVPQLMKGLGFKTVTG
jgi:hypothetical protein